MSNEPKIKTIMLVDDEEVDQMLYRRVLTRSGIVEDVISFTYPDEALDYLKRSDRNPIDLLLLDINMPRLNGFEFLDRATKECAGEFANAVVIMLTTSLDPSDLARSEQYAVVKGYINKPLKIDDVKKIARELHSGTPAT